MNNLSGGKVNSHFDVTEGEGLLTSAGANPRPNLQMPSSTLHKESLHVNPCISCHTSRVPLVSKPLVSKPSPEQGDPPGVLRVPNTKTLGPCSSHSEHLYPGTISSNPSRSITDRSRSNCPRPNTDVLNLPPATCPYVLVLAGVPTLKGDQRESWVDLCNKTVDWLKKYKGFHPSDLNEILMVRRVGWVGHSPKNINGDCMVINFSQAPNGSLPTKVLRANI